MRLPLIVMYKISLEKAKTSIWKAELTEFFSDNDLEIKSVCLNKFVILDCRKLLV